ncbi:MAG: nicotinate (nicotinamide) nucleotide adenylyltransferase [Chitinispirillaceae bacterium]|nr:nicotinate (nicotinamide) nucleotide adenylyltransferase [Chitinispirillaceae bacterium]
MSNPIGIFGGIFDPVHYGHLAVGRLAFDHFNLEKIIYVPAGIPPHKVTSASVSPEERLEMLRIALEGETSTFIWEKEVRRPEVSYTVDTLSELTKLHPGSPLYFLVGADNLVEIPTWHRYRDILEMVTLCVTERPGYSMEIPPAVATTPLLTFPSPQWGISSSLLRSYLAQGYQCKHLLPEGVREYIFTRGLYRQCGTTIRAVKCKQNH